MIGVMEKTPEAAPSEKEEAVAPKQKKADVRTQSITSFFKPPSKPSPQAQETKATDLRNYFQVTKTGDVPDQPKISSAKNNQDKSKVEKASVTEDGDGIQSSTKDKAKTGKRKGETKRVCKKPKKQKEDSQHKSDDEDFELPPPNRRKRKSRLDSDSITDFIDTEDRKQIQDPSETAGLESKVGQDEMEVSEVDAVETSCNGQDALNNSTVVSYEDFLKNSMADGDDGESDVEIQETFENKDDAETKTGDAVPPAEDDDPPDLVMLTPPDSRCSQESPKEYQPATSPANQDARKEEEANDSDTCLRKVITVKAQVHSPIDGRDKDSSPSASPMLQTDIISRKGGLGPRRLISNVSVLDSSPELSLISVETKEEPKKTGPVYSIFKPRPIGPKKEVTKKEPVKDNTQAEAIPVKDLPKKEVKFNDAVSKDKRAKEIQEESKDNTETVNKQVDENNVKEKKKKVNAKQSSLTGKDETAKKSKKGAATRNDSSSQGNSSLASKPSTKSKSSVKKKDQDEDSSVPTRRVLRARVTKRSTDAESSMDEFDDVKPLNTKPHKQTKKASQCSKKTPAKAEVKVGKKGSDSSKASEPQKFKSSLITGVKGQGSIKLKLTAIKASPKKNSKVAKAQQLLQKAKKGHQTTLGSKGQASKQLLKKKNTQWTFPSSKSKEVPSKDKKSSTEEKKGKQKETKGKVEKKGGGGAQKDTLRRRSSSRNKPKTPPKPAAKLAPIFTKQGQLAAAKKFKQESIMALDEASRDSLTDSRDIVNDPSGQGLGFNMLEQLKLETTLPQRDSGTQLTKACHVLQKDDANPFWKLPIPELGQWKLRDESKPNLSPSNLKSTPSSSSSITPSSSTHHFMLYNKPTTVSESDKKAVMDEILKANPKFPVHKVFKMYQAKKNGETQKKAEDKSDTKITEHATQESAASSKGGPSGKTSRLSRGKRKAEDVTDEDSNTRRKMARRSGRASARRSLETSLDGKPSSQGDVGDTEERSLRRSSRRSSRRISTTEEDGEKKDGDGEKKDGDWKESEGQKEEYDGKKEVVVEESQEEKRRAGMLWTERYQPSAVSEMIGNATICRKFSSWMAEWKKKTQRMKEKTKGKNKSKSKGSKRMDSDDESDDDFCYNDSDDSEEEDGLCNTVLLSGPHGVGKTSLVYACAQELGFEVFEVNASSRRNGRQIIAQLGEGTQSHQVARQPGLSSARFFNASPSKLVPKTASPKKKKKPELPKAFAGFVKVGSSTSLNSKRSPVKKPSVKKSPKKAVKQSPIKKISSSQTSGSINKPKVTSTSLILFDEVDIIFEEDKGFLSTVISFMESSKRPIVLTTSDPRFSFSLSARYDELTFKPPPLNPLVSHLKLMCLAEDLPISHHDLRLVAEFFDRDIRRCLHHLQFWVGSGAMPKSSAIQQGSSENCDEKGLKKNPSDSMPNSQSVSDDMDTSDEGGSKNQVNGVADELTQELIDLETRIIAVGEYYSMKGYKPKDVVKIMDDMGLTDKTTKDTCNEINSIQGIMGCSYRTGLGNYCGLLESIAGIGNIAGPVIDSLNLLKHLHDPIILAGVLQAFHDVSIDAVHCNLPQILASLSTSKETKSKTASLSSNHKSPTKSPDNELTEDEKQKASKLGSDLIDIMSEHADRMSEMDTLRPLGQRQDSHLNRYGNHEWWHPLLLPGLNDKEGWIGDDYELIDVRPCDSRGELNIVDMNCCLEAMSLRDCLRRCRRKVGAMQDDSRWDEIQRTVLPSNDERLLRIEAIKSDVTLRETSSAVVRRLPDYLYTHHSALTLDYLPTLRGICRYEELRREANLKRRFFHYLDSISFCLRAVTHTSLARILNPSQHASIKQSL